MEHSLSWLVFLEELKIGKRSTHVFPDLSHRGTLCDLGPTCHFTLMYKRCV